MNISVAIALLTELALGIKNAIEANSDTLTDADVDKAIAGLDASDQSVTDAIERARRRHPENN